jgi:hypothetical protein
MIWPEFRLRRSGIPDKGGSIGGQADMYRRCQSRWYHRSRIQVKGRGATSWKGRIGSLSVTSSPATS